MRKFPLVNPRYVHFPVPGDGNCFFTAVIVSVQLNKETCKTNVGDDNAKKMGRFLRSQFLKKVSQAVTQGQLVQGLPLSDILLDPRLGDLNMTKYIERMTVATDRCPEPWQWGGFAEARVLAEPWMFGLRVYIVERFEDESLQLFTDPFGPIDTGRRCILELQQQNHYNAIKMDSDACAQLELNP